MSMEYVNPTDETLARYRIPREEWMRRTKAIEDLTLSLKMSRIGAKAIIFAQEEAKVLMLEHENSLMILPGGALEMEDVERTQNETYPLPPTFEQICSVGLQREIEEELGPHVVPSLPGSVSTGSLYAISEWLYGNISMIELDDTTRKLLYRATDYIHTFTIPNTEAVRPVIQSADRINGFKFVGLDELDGLEGSIATNNWDVLQVFRTDSTIPPQGKERRIYSCGNNYLDRVVMTWDLRDQELPADIAPHVLGRRRVN